MWYSVADLEGAGGRIPRPPPLPFQTHAYIVYYFKEKRMNNLTLQILLNFM